MFLQRTGTSSTWEASETERCKGDVLEGVGLARNTGRWAVDQSLGDEE